MNDIKRLIVKKPEKCPFRCCAPHYDDYGEYCTLQVDVEKGFGNEMCYCTDDCFIKDCPLLKSDFLVVRK